MSFRFFVDQPVKGSSFVLEGEQAHHLQNVMRKRVGDSVVLFDGSGCEFCAEITTLKKRRVTLRLVSRSEVSRELDRAISIACALPKGNRQKFLIEKLVEVGVSQFIPILAERSVADCDDGVRARLTRHVIEACKQCGRNVLMEIAPRHDLKQLCDVEFDSPTRRLVADPSAADCLSQIEPSLAVAVAIGPEGGFTEEERLQLNDAGWQSVGLGPAILRIETAALAAAATLGVGRFRC